MIGPSATIALDWAELSDAASSRFFAALGAASPPDFRAIAATLLTKLGAEQARAAQLKGMLQS